VFSSCQGLQYQWRMLIYLCPPNCRYDTSDSVSRSSSTLVLARVEAAARHSVNVTMALASFGGRAELSDKVGYLSLHSIWPW